MLGNCAIGRLRTVKVPTSTRTMEITIATIGRLMKNFDMRLFILCLHAKRLGVHLDAGSHLLKAFGDNSFAWIQPLRNNPAGSNTVTDRNGSNAHFVVGTYDGNLVTSLKLRHRALRNNQRTLLKPDDSANFRVTSGPQNIARIGKQAGDANRAGTDIDLAVGKVERALMGIG